MIRQMLATCVIVFVLAFFFGGASSIFSEKRYDKWAFAAAAFVGIMFVDVCVIAVLLLIAIWT